MNFEHESQVQYLLDVHTVWQALEFRTVVVGIVHQNVHREQLLKMAEIF